MPIPFQCPQCGVRGKAPDKLAGRLVTCPKCSGQVEIVKVEWVPPPPPTSPPAGATPTATKLVIGVAVLGVVGVAGMIAYSFLPPAQVPEVAAAVAEAPEVPKQAQEEPEDPVAIIGDESPLPLDSPGFGLTLDKFKKDTPIGTGWKVLDETLRDDGTIVFQLLGIAIPNTLLSVSGNPADLREVSFTFSATDEHSQSDTISRVGVMCGFLSRYSNWTIEEIGEVFGRFIKAGEADTGLHVQKDGHEFWITVMAVENGTMFMTGVSAKPNSDAPTMEEWLADHVEPNHPPIEFDGRTWNYVGPTDDAGEAERRSMSAILYTTDDPDVRLIEHVPRPGSGEGVYSRLLQVQAKRNGRWVNHGPEANWTLRGTRGESSYVDGKHSGTQREWHANGKLWIERDIVDGKYHGRARGWHDNGQLEHDAIYRDDVEIEGKNWDRDGNPL